MQNRQLDYCVLTCIPYLVEMQNFALLRVQTRHYGAVHILYNAREGGGGVDNLLYALYGGGGLYYSYCYITKPDFYPP